MVAPLTVQELLKIKEVNTLANSNIDKKKKQLLAANKLAARIMLLEISSSYITTVAKDNRNGK